ncbi:OLC1v1038006C1 [Oldenlandia corymbosa var. corymbosa]|nr:OLC1v1038006C1 [Oldenlandia corymbosa var. corymbosa]
MLSPMQLNELEVLEGRISERIRKVDSTPLHLEERKYFHEELNGLLHATCIIGFPRKVKLHGEVDDSIILEEVDVPKSPHRVITSEETEATLETFAIEPNEDPGIEQYLDEQWNKFVVEKYYGLLEDILLLIRDTELE